MFLIATDEAGYGPKLGPLVIVSTTWRLPTPSPEPEASKRRSPEQLGQLFAGLQEPIECDRMRIVIDDSKAVYQSKGKDGLAKLHAAVSAAIGWTEIGKRDSRAPHLEPFIADIANNDFATVTATPWLSHLSNQAFLSTETTSPVIDQWSASGLQLQSIAARIVTARCFNEACESGMNKADLLSESTLALVRRTMESCDGNQDNVDIFCDRHGGRRFYAGVLQHTFDQSAIEMVSESKRQSVYQFEHAGRRAKIRFTVKGDSFTPVAMSSIIAKYLRERFMQSLNQYFQDLHEGDLPLKPTAGYPVDADRFLADVASIVRKQKIAERDLVRQR